MKNKFTKTTFRILICLIVFVFLLTPFVSSVVAQTSGITVVGCQCTITAKYSTLGEIATLASDPLKTEILPRLSGSMSCTYDDDSDIVTCKYISSRNEATCKSLTHEQILAEKGVSDLDGYEFGASCAWKTEQQVLDASTWSLEDCQAHIKAMGYEFTPELYDEEAKQCYAPQAPFVSLSFPFGDLIGKEQVSIGMYVQEAYKFGFVMAIALAILMIIIGGFLWILGGAADTIGTAKDMIIQAIIGLVILSSAYLLLNTINPRLVSLDIPQIPVVRPLTVATKSSCDRTTDGTGTKEAGEFCTGGGNVNDCRAGLTCYEIDKTLETGALVAVAAPFVIMGGASLAGGAAALSAKSAVVTAGKGVASIARLAGLRVLAFTAKKAKNAVFHPIRTAGTITYGTIAAEVGQSVYNFYEETQVNIDGCTEEDLEHYQGVCIKLAVNSVPDNGTCRTDSNCLSGKCLCSEGSEKNDDGQCPGAFGICTSGDEGNVCYTDKDCKESLDLKCLDTFLIGGARFAYCTSSSNRGIGLVCGKNSDCKPGLVCHEGNCYDIEKKSYCAKNIPCPSGYSCQEHKCKLTDSNAEVNGSVGMQCLDDLNCYGELFCDEGKCTLGCKSRTDCKDYVKADKMYTCSSDDLCILD